MILLTALREYIFGKPDETTERLKTSLANLKNRERTNLLARVAARLEAMDRDGVPYALAPAVGNSGERPGTAAARGYKVHYVYERNSSGYPYQPAIRFEQDPLFGWNTQAFPFDPFDLWTEVAVNSFPRELFPDRPTTLRTQIAQDAVRLQSRIWFETCPQYSGPIGHLVNFVCGSGLTVDVVVNKNKQGTVYEQAEETDRAGGDPADPAVGGGEEESPEEKLAAQVQEYIDGLCSFRTNDCTGRCEQSALNLLRDGEDALRAFPAPPPMPGEEDTFPILRTVDTSTIRGPHNEITGPWAFGVLTDWPRDWETPLAYHLWYSDNKHEDVSPEEMHLCKLFTVGANVKRGTPLAYKIRKQIPQAVKLLDCIAVGEAARQAIPYVREFEAADSTAVRAATPSWLDQLDSIDDDFGAAVGGHHRRRNEIEPGAVPLINRGQHYLPPPPGDGQSGQIASLVLDEKIAAALQVPLWFVKASTDEETKANALTAGAPVVLLIRRIQRKLCEHYRCIFEYAVKMGIAAGKLPAQTLQKVQIHCELPNPETRAEDPTIASDMEMLNAKLLSPQHFCARHDLDFEEEQDLITKAEKLGWENPGDQQMEEGGLPPLPETEGGDGGDVSGE